MIYEYIKTETNPEKLYNGIRAILSDMYKKGMYPDDWEIKKIQRAADARYNELTGGTK